MEPKIPLLQHLKGQMDTDVTCLWSSESIRFKFRFFGLNVKSAAKEQKKVKDQVADTEVACL